MTSTTFTPGSFSQLNATWQSLPYLPSDLLGDGASASALYVAPVGTSHVLTVGAGEEYSTLSAALAASHDGDVIEVQAGTYVNQTAIVDTKVTIEGVGGMVNLVETQPVPNEKGILVVKNDATIANIWFSGASVSNADGANGAGIRYEGGNLTLINDVFTNNQDGIMGNPVEGLASNTETIEHCTFADNGVADPSLSEGYGYTHDAYIGSIGTATVIDSVFAGVTGVGHELKSRATVNNISGNVIADLDSAASYTVDLPNGGDDALTGNYIEQGANSPNYTIISYSEESIPYAGSALTVEGNTIVNESTAAPMGINNRSMLVADVTGNTIIGLATAQLVNGAVSASDNTDGSGSPLADSTPAQLVPPGFLDFTDSAPHTVTLTTGDAGVIGGAGLLTVYGDMYHLVVDGGSGGLFFYGEAGMSGDTITTATGSTNTVNLPAAGTVNSQGNDIINFGTGNAVATVSGDAQIDGGSGANHFSVTGTAALSGNRGDDFITIGNYGSVAIEATENALEITSSGGSFDVTATVAGMACSASVAGGSVYVQSYSNALNFNTSGGPTQGSVIRLGTENDGVLSHAADTIYAGSGNDMLQLSSGGQTVYAGSGELTIYGRGISATDKAIVYGNGGDYLISGDTGNIVYVGGALASTVEAHLGNITIVGGAGHITINGGARDTITGGAGGITLNGGVADTITTAAGSINTLVLTGGCAVTSNGTDRIDAGHSNQRITVNGDAAITDASGANHITLNGTDQLTATGGNEQVTVGSGAHVTIATAAWTYLAETGAIVHYAADAAGDGSNVTVTGGAASIASHAGSQLTVETTAGQSTGIDLGQGTAEVVLRGTDTVHAGGGVATIIACTGGERIVGGGGALTVSDRDWYGVGDTLSIQAGSGATQVSAGGRGTIDFIGGSGDAVIASSSGFGSLNVTAGTGSTDVTAAGTLLFVAGAGSSNINIGAQDSAVTFGGGDTTVTRQVSWGAADIFRCVAGQGGGTNIINGFRAGTDQLDLQGVGVASKSVLGGSTYLTLTDNTHVQLMGVANFGVS